MSDSLTAASWKLAAHSAAKLDILGRYLRAWFPILSNDRTFGRIIYIDGFAGPGRYEDSEDGSPIIALKAAIGAIKGSSGISFEFHFVERKRRVAAALAANIEQLRRQVGIPESVEISVHAGMAFEVAFDRAIRYRLEVHPNSPAFALVDPFGWTGVPMNILGELMRRPSTEVLMNFMFEEINRFINHPEQVSNFDRLFGCESWRKAYAITGTARKSFIHDLYRDQLRVAAGAKYVRSFEMRNERNISDYFLYFASNNLLGLSKMKEAMWKVDPHGAFSFSDATNLDQSVLFQPEPDRRALRRLVSERFSERRATIKEIRDFVIEFTPFHAGHYKKVLATMEADGDVTPINPMPERRRGTFADPNLLLEFRKMD